MTKEKLGTHCRWSSVGASWKEHNARPKSQLSINSNLPQSLTTAAPFWKGGKHILDQIGYMPGNFNCLGVPRVVQTMQTAADARETLRFCLFLFLKQNCCINTYPLCFLCAKLLMMPFFAICPRASLKIHEWAHWPDILWGTGAIVCPWRLALKIWLRILEKEHLQQSVREQLGRDLATC